jgi:cytochrome P450
MHSAHFNTTNLVFWVCTYILFDEKLREEIFNETRPAMLADGVDVGYLSRNCPILDSVFHEVNRVANSILPGRKVIAPTRIGESLLQPGGSVFVPCQHTHMDESTWGASRFEFDPYRFMKNPHLRRHEHYRPFGGGVTMCPGRHIARLQIFIIVTTLLHRFDARLAACPDGVRQQFPKYDDTRPPTGVNRCLPGMQVMVDIARLD